MNGKNRLGSFFYCFRTNNSYTKSLMNKNNSCVPIMLGLRVRYRDTFSHSSLPLMIEWPLVHQLPDAWNAFSLRFFLCCRLPAPFARLLFVRSVAICSSFSCNKCGYCSLLFQSVDFKTHLSPSSITASPFFLFQWISLQSEYNYALCCLSMNICCGRHPGDTWNFIPTIFRMNPHFGIKLPC